MRRAGARSHFTRSRQRAAYLPARLTATGHRGVIQQQPQWNLFVSLTKVAQDDVTNHFDTWRPTPAPQVVYLGSYRNLEASLTPLPAWTAMINYIAGHVARRLTHPAGPAVPQPSTSPATPVIVATPPPLQTEEWRSTDKAFRRSRLPRRNHSPNALVDVTLGRAQPQPPRAAADRPRHPGHCRCCCRHPRRPGSTPDGPANRSAGPRPTTGLIAVATLTRTAVPYPPDNAQTIVADNTSGPRIPRSVHTSAQQGPYAAATL